MSKFKRVICIFIVMLFCGFSLAGCALFERDIDYYNNLTVASFGDDIRITKKELIEGYESFGYQYQQEYGMSKAEALDIVLEILIDRKIALEVAVPTFYDIDNLDEIRELANKQEVNDFYYRILGEIGRNGSVRQSANDQAQARYLAQTALDDYIKNTAETIRKENGTGSTPTEKPETETSGEVYTPYEKLVTAYYVNGEKKYKMNLEGYAEQKDYIMIAWPTFNHGGATRWTYTPPQQGISLTEQSISEKAKNRLVLLLKQREIGVKVSDTSDNAIIEREYLRIREEEAKNILVAKIKSCFEQGLRVPLNKESDEYLAILENFKVDSVAYDFAVSQLNADKVESLVRDATQLYKGSVLDAIDRYDVRKDDDEASIRSAVLNDANSVYYVPQSMINRFFEVSHILISYSEEQTAKIAGLKEEYKHDEATYKIELEKVQAQTKTKVRDTETGEYIKVGGVEVEMSAAQVLAAVRRDVNPTRYDVARDFNKYATEPQWQTPGDTYSIELQREAFREAIYKYNADPGMFTSDSEYVMSLDETTMVEQFTKAARELYYNNKTGQIEGVVGSMSGLVYSEYGVHIIMYTRNYSERVYNNKSVPIESMLDATLSSYRTKTILDLMLEQVTRADYETYERTLIAGYKSDQRALGNEIKIYRSNFKDITK